MRAGRAASRRAGGVGQDSRPHSRERASWPPLSQPALSLSSLSPQAARPDTSPPDPFTLAHPEVTAVAERMRRCAAEAAAPAPLVAAASHFLRPGAAGKRFRPALVLLVGTAVGGGGPTPAELEPDVRAPGAPPHGRRRRLQALAEVAETIHVASLLHDDVIDGSSTRRGGAAAHVAVGSAKVAVLAGDFLLARASLTLAALRHHGVTALMSRAIADLVAGEVAQATAAGEDLVSLRSYERRAYLKTGTLFANAAAGAALLTGGGAPWPGERVSGGGGVNGEGAASAAAPTSLWAGPDGPAAAAAAWALETGIASSDPTGPLLDPPALAAAAAAAAAYGASLGLAFQVVDDALDYSSPASLLGKPALADAAAGIVTAPVLLAMRAEPELVALARRRFKRAGDPAAAAALVASGGGVAAARALAASHAADAVAALGGLPPTTDPAALAARAALVELAGRVAERVK